MLVSKIQVPVTSQAGITADWRAPNVVPALIAARNAPQSADRALITTLTYSFVRITTALKMKVEVLRECGA